MIARRPARIRLRPISLKDEADFLEAVSRSRRLHRPWVYPPATKERFRRYVKTQRQPVRVSYSVRAVTGDLVGLINISEIVRGVFHSGYLGYYIFAPYQRQGFMLAGLSAAIGRALRNQGLHRLEANIQPGNRASIALVKRLGFRREGYSPRYLKVGGRWRDHERWAITVEDWRKTRKP
jgi:ribosomal-protein-alanine N-acetyltransferase